jgi:hypothetical protein
MRDKLNITIIPGGGQLNFGQSLNMLRQVEKGIAL